MKFLTLADRSGLVEMELLPPLTVAMGYIIRYPVLEVTARVEPSKIIAAFQGFCVLANRETKRRWRRYRERAD